MATVITGPNKTILLARGTSRAKWFTRINAESASSSSRIRDAVAHASRDTLWLSFERNLTRSVLRAAHWPSPPLGCVVLLHHPDIETLPALSSCFGKVIFSLHNGFLPPAQLGEVLSATNRENLFIGGSVNRQDGTVTLWRGNLASLTVPLSTFKPAGDGIKPDFNRFSIRDYGHTVKFGAYEAAADAILYEFDQKYRRLQSKARIASERSFGASLRRLRKQRRLRREDFGPLSAKTIGRIEQGKVTRIRDNTRRMIAKTLGVSADEIETY